MNVASLDNCRELYELSGWVGDEEAYFFILDDGSLKETNVFASDVTGTCYKYTLGFLLRRLRRCDSIGAVTIEVDDISTQARASFYDNNENKFWSTVYSDTDPEDALCQLAIELFKQDVLTRVES